MKKNNWTVITDIFFHFIGGGWTALSLVIFVPFYIKYLGVAAYGVVGLITAMRSILMLLDMGFGAAFNREISKYAVSDRIKLKNCAFTYEVVYGLMALAISVIFFISLNLFFKYFVTANPFSTQLLIKVEVLMSVAFALQWPQTIYNQGLLALQRHKEFNFIQMVCNTLKGVMTIVALHFLAKNLVTFATCYMLVTLLQLGWSRMVFWKNITKPSAKMKFDVRFFTQIWKFSLGVNAMTIMVIFMMTIDKILIGRFLGLEKLGYYNLAWVLASVLSYIAGPLIPVILPIFNRLAHLRKNDLLEHYLQISVQLMAALIFPVMTLIFFFSYPIIKIWSHQELIATNSSLLLSILILGSAVNAFTNIYWQLDLASGKTKMWVISNFIFLIVLIPLLVLMIQRYELLGAAYIYLAYHLLNFLIIVPSVILRSFNLKVLRHTFQDLLISFVLTGIIVLAFNHYFSAKLNSDFQYLGYFVLVLAVTIALNGLFLPKLRLWAQSELTHFLKN